MSKGKDFSKLSREEKLKLLDAAEEKKRRVRETREAFTPHDGQLPICQSEKYIRGVVCSNSFGKTALCVNEALWAALGYNPVTKKTSFVPAHVVVVLDKPSKVEDPWLKEVRKWYNLREEQLDKEGKPYYSRIDFDNGSTISFMFHEQTELSFESISDISAIIMDEMPPRHAFIALTRGQRDKHLKPWVLIATTMISSSWMYKDLYIPWTKDERDDVEFFSGNMRQNEKNLADGYIERFSRNLTEKEKIVRIEGGWDQIDGLALAHLFKKDTHVIKPIRWPISWPVVIAIDPAMRKPHVACMVGITPENQYVYLKELRLKGGGKEFATALKQFYNGFRVTNIVCDSMGSSDLTGGDGVLSFIKVLQNNGIRVRPTRYDEKDDEAFISMIRDVLEIPEEADNFGKKLPKLRIIEGNKGIISDIETAAWVKIKNTEEFKPKIDITQKDHLACLKYALAEHPKFQAQGKIIKSAGPVGWGGRSSL